MRILLTGAAGFLGRGIRESLAPLHDVICLDPVDTEPVREREEIVLASVTDREAIARVMAGVDTLVITHMLSRTTERGAYQESPSAAIDVNVKGTLLLMQEAVKNSVRRVILISSESVVRPFVAQGGVVPHDAEPTPAADLYILTKVFQEKVVEGFHNEYGIEVVVLRIGGVCRVDPATRRVYPKYEGAEWTRNEPGMVERGDVGLAVGASVQLEHVTYERMFVMGSSLARQHFDVQYTEKKLGWRPRFDFSWMDGRGPTRL